MRVRTDAKRREILEVARAAFLRHGYAAVSMAAIAAEVGGSKGTLYGYFPSKEALFSAVLRSVEEEHALPALTILDREGSVREILTALARAVIRFSLLPEALASYRLAVAEAGRFPELSQSFYENGRLQAYLRIAAWMRAQIDAGRLHPAEPQWLAQQFARLCQAGPLEAALFGLERQVPAEEQAELADFAVETFLRAHATPRGDAQLGRPRGVVRRGADERVEA
jgi:AcrR family transcriptional regulator